MEQLSIRQKEINEAIQMGKDLKYITVIESNELTRRNSAKSVHINNKIIKVSTHKVIHLKGKEKIIMNAILKLVEDLKIDPTTRKLFLDIQSRLIKKRKCIRGYVDIMENPVSYPSDNGIPPPPCDEDLFIECLIKRRKI